MYKSNNVLLSSKRQGSTYRVIPDNCILNSEIITRPASWLEISGVARFFVIGSTIDDVVIIAQFPQVCVNYTFVFYAFLHLHAAVLIFRLSLQKGVVLGKRFPLSFKIFFYEFKDF